MDNEEWMPLKSSLIQIMFLLLRRPALLFQALITKWASDSAESVTSYDLYLKQADTPSSLSVIIRLRLTLGNLLGTLGFKSDPSSTLK